MPEKKCDGCARVHSDEWNLIKELATSNRRRFVVIILLVSLWLITVFAFLWHINTEPETENQGSCIIEYQPPLENVDIACNENSEELSPLSYRAKGIVPRKTK